MPRGWRLRAKENNELTVLEVAYEMYARGYEFKDMVLGESEAARFKISDGKVLLPVHGSFRHGRDGGQVSGR